MNQVTFCEQCGVEILAIAAFCTNCGAHRTPTPAVHAIAPAVARSVPEPVDDGGMIECPQCAELIRERAKVCRFCDYDLVRRGRGRSSALSVGRARIPTRVHVEHSVSRSPGVAAVLAFFWPGLGHIYAGRLGRGFAVMFAPLFVAILFFAGLLTGHRPGQQMSDGKIAAWAIIVLVVSVIVYLWQIADAYSCAQPTYSSRRRRY